tara:strand:- start:922 stop:2067 length:1146 start_codon:yes stop_codon:yes gene_type:complete
MLSLFPEDESLIFIDINDILSENIDKKYDVKCIFYTIYENMKYPYASFLFEYNNNLLDFFKTEIIGTNEIDSFLETIQSNLEHFIIYRSKVKYYYDLKSNTIFLFCEYKKLISIVDYENNNYVYELISSDILNHGGSYDKVLKTSCKTFFLKHNYILYVKNHKQNIKYPTPLSLYKGSKNLYLNDIVLFGEVRFMFKNNFTFTDYNSAVLESLNYYVLNMDNYLLILKNVKAFNKIKNKKYIIKKSNILTKDGKKIASFDNSLIKDDTVIEVINYNKELQTIHIKIKEDDLTEIDVGEYVYPFYDKIIDNENRIILKYVIFSDNLSHENEINNKGLLEYFNIENNDILNKYFTVKSKEKQYSFELKSKNLNNIHLSEYYNI